jgi:hypothetical protein
MQSYYVAESHKSEGSPAQPATTEVRGASSAHAVWHTAINPEGEIQYANQY